jgi:hypothetical protein
MLPGADEAGSQFLAIPVAYAQSSKAATVPSFASVTEAQT